MADPVGTDGPGEPAVRIELAATDHPMEAHKVDSKAIFYLGKSDDAKEGVSSFLEKRPPTYPGKVSTDMPPHYPWWPERKFR